MRLRGGGKDKQNADIVICSDSEDELPEENAENTLVVEDYIGIGLKWSDLMPTEVVQARNRARAIPPNVLETLLPQDSTSASDILSHHLPPPLSSAHAKYSFDPPDCLLDKSTMEGAIHAASQHLWASSAESASLRNDFDASWLQGALSIILPTDPKRRYPLWSERVLIELHAARQKMEAWQKASAWLADKATTDTACELHAAECEEVFECIPWNGKLLGVGRAVGLRTPGLASFLSEDWLDDEMVNAGLDYILQEMGSDGGEMLVNSLLLGSLQQAKARGSYVVRPSNTLATRIQERRVEILHIPINVRNVHWTVLSIDINSFTYSYSDSLHSNATAPTDALDTFQWWLQILRPDLSTQSLAHVPALYTIPTQTDSFSCGVIVLSTLAAHLLELDEWSQSSEPTHRLQWFLRLSASFNDDSEACDDDDDDVDPTAIKMVEVSSSGVHNSVTELDEVSFDFEDSPDTSAEDAVKPSGKRMLAASECTVGAKPTKRVKRKNNVIHPCDADPYRLATFKRKIHKLDQHAEFHRSNALKVRCASCALWIRMRTLYDVKYYKTHRKHKRCRDNRATKTITKSIAAYFSHPRAQASVAISVPCPGLLAEDCAKVSCYLRRTATHGGGAPSRRKIAKVLYGDDVEPWRNLGGKRRAAVLRREAALYKWRNHRNLGAVFSTSCLSQVEVMSDADTIPPCTNCSSLYHLHTFQVQLNRRSPPEENMKYVPKIWRDVALGTLYLKHTRLRALVEDKDGRSPWLMFALKVKDGVFKSNDIVAGMVQALVIKSERQRMGKSLRNMTYSRAFTDFTNTLASLAPRAYRTIRKHIGGPEIRTLQKMRAKAPRFEPGISAANVAACKAVLRKLEYHGPLTLSWDDTALEPAITIWERSKAGACVILGSASGPIEVASEAEFDQHFEAAAANKADKLRLYLLGVPLAKVPPLVVATIARGSRSSGEELAKMHAEVMDLLRAEDLWPISHAADGTDVERTAQHLVESGAKRFVTYVVKSPVAGCEGIKIKIYFDDESERYPFVMLQDSSHARKTGRNQLCTGARVITLGDSPCYFSQLYRLASHPGSPMFPRDVRRVDKQDDGAACRVTAAPTLKHHMSENPHQVGLSVYVFVIGEMVDAYQNRHITHVERISMVMTARYFLMAWRAHIDNHPDHSLHIHFISRESYEIFLMVCDGLLALILIYRNYYPSYPLLPWLHSTEGCEHIFGTLRNLKADFNAIDVLYLQPKLRVLLLSAFNNVLDHDGSNRSAAGYFHSYYLTDDINLAALTSWPSNEDMEKACQRGYEGAKQLLSAIRIDADAMLKLYRPPSQAPKVQKATAGSTPRGPQTLAELISLYEHPGLSFTTKKEDEIEACQTALVAEGIHGTLQIESLPDSSDDDFAQIQEVIKQGCTRSGHTEADTTDSAEAYDVNKVVALVDPITKKLDPEVLVHTRQRHEPLFVAKSVRKAVAGYASIHGHPSKNMTPTLRLCLLKKLVVFSIEARHAAESSGTTTGVNRQVRHTGSYSNTSGVRAANKETLLSVASKSFMERRAKAFVSLSGIHENMLTANINDLSILADGGWVFVWKKVQNKYQLVLGQVITMYSGTKHDWIESTNSLGKLSYVMMTAFLPFGGLVFSSNTCPRLDCPTILRVERTHIVLSLGCLGQHFRVQDIDNTGAQMVTTCQETSLLYEALSNQMDEIARAVKTLSQRVQGNVGDEDTVEEADEAEDASEEDGMMGDLLDVLDETQRGEFLELLKLAP